MINESLKPMSTMTHRVNRANNTTVLHSLPQVPVVEALCHHNVTLEDMQSLSLVCRRMCSATSTYMGQMYVFHVEDVDDVRRVQERFHARHLCWNSKQVLNAGDLPAHLVTLHFGHKFTFHLLGSKLRNRVCLIFNQHLNIGVLPPALKHLTFGSKFDQPLTVGIIPQTVTHIDFGSLFDQPLEVGVLPPFLTHLTLSTYFNQPLQVGVLPRTLTHLTFGFVFDQPLEVGVLPQSLTHLVFGHSFNQPLAPGLLPVALTHLTFGDSFRSSLVRLDILPTSVVHLEGVHGVLLDEFHERRKKRLLPFTNAASRTRPDRRES